MISIPTFLISISFAFSLGCICTLLAYECPECKCDCTNNKKQLLKG